MKLISLFGTGFFLTFLGCALGSGLLQLLAWSRHAREGVPVSLKALWNPGEYFDGVGLRQMLLARRLMLVGIVAYLSYGVLMVLSSTLAS